jgi:hypothetical protein
MTQHKEAALPLILENSYFLQRKAVIGERPWRSDFDVFLPLMVASFAHFIPFSSGDPCRVARMDQYH